MKFFCPIFKLLLYTFIFLGISNSSYSKILNFNQDAKSVSSYFSGIVAFDDINYSSSLKFLKSFSESEDVNINFSSKFLQSLVNLEKYNEAYQYSKKLEKKNLSNFESNLVLGLFEFKRNNYSKAKFYFEKLDLNYEHGLILDPLKISLKNWSDIGISKNEKSIELIKAMPPQYGTFKIVQEAFAHCHLDTQIAEKEFNKIIKNEKNAFYRYNFFFADFLIEKEKYKEAQNIANLTSKKFPRNLLINQFAENLKNKSKNRNDFSCKKAEHIVAEIFYAFANALATQQNYKLSNFYISLSKYLNPNFLSYNE